MCAHEKTQHAVTLWVAHVGLEALTEAARVLAKFYIKGVKCST